MYERYCPEGVLHNFNRPLTPLTLEANADTLAGVAAIIRSIGLAVVLPVGVFLLLYRPPKWLETSWKRAKAKFGVFEGEIERTTVEVPPNPPASSVTAPEAPVVSEEPNAVVTASAKTEHWYALVTNGRYAEGIEAAKLEAASKATVADQLGQIAFARAVGFMHGETEALDELRTMVTEHPNLVEVRLWYAHALNFGDRFDDAIREAKTALDAATSEPTIADAARTLAGYLTDANKYDDAAAVALQALRTVSRSKERALLFHQLGTTFERRGDTHRAFVFFEAGLREEPNDANQRFDVAYKYGQAGAHASALSHYRRLLATDPANQTYLNNSGWASENLKMPIRAASFYRRAGDEGSTLAMSNLASIYLNAGLVEEARDHLTRAQQAEDVDDRVLTTLGELARRTESEKSTNQELTEFAEALTKLRLMEADALVDTLAPVSAMAGMYMGTPTGATILVDSTGNVEGTFPGGLFGASARIAGRVDGSVARFSWTTVNPIESSSLLGQLGASSGEGILFYRDKSLVGCSVEGRFDLGAVKPKSWLNWSLRPVQSSPIKLVPLPPLRIAPPPEQ